MITGCLAHIKTKSHLACNKMTLGPSENFAGSSRSSSADLSLVPVFTVQHCNIAQQSVFNIAISLNQHASVIFPHTCDNCHMPLSANSSLNWHRPPPHLGQTQTFPQKAPCVTLLTCLTQLVPNESQICRALDVLQPICALARRPFRPIYAFDQCVLCGSISWAL